MDRRQHRGGRWNTGQLLRRIEESHFATPDERRHVESPSPHTSRSLASRFGMTEMSCFPSSRSRRAFARTELQHDVDLVRRQSLPRRGQVRGSEPGASSSRQDRGKSHVFPKTGGGGGRSGLVIRDTNQLPTYNSEGRSSYFTALFGHVDSQSDSDDQVFDLPLVDETSETDARPQTHRNVASETTTNSRSSTKRKSYGGSSSRASGSNTNTIINTNNGGGASNKSREEHLRGLNLRRSSSSTVSRTPFPSSMDGHRPQKIRVSRRSVDVSGTGTSSAAYHASGTGEHSQPSSYNELITGHLERQTSSRRPASSSMSSASRSRRSYEASSSTDAFRRSLRSLSSTTRPRSSSSSSSSTGEWSSHRLGRAGPSRSLTRGRAHEELTNSSSHILTRRNVSNCFPVLGSQGRRASSSPSQVGRSSGLHVSDLPSSSAVSLLGSTLDNMMPSSSSYQSSGRGESSSSQEGNWSSTFGWEYHRPRLMAEGLAKILMALERVETEDELTHEQLLMLEATVLFSGMALHDQHRDWRMDVDSMSYEELLDLGERIGNVSTGLNKDAISTRLSKTIFCSTKSGLSRCGEENEIKCTICQEEYQDGEQLGWIDCGHQYHSECIRKWLVQKNICPICKATALS